jgi:hypothetical protein
MPQGTAFGMGAHCWLPLRDWRAGVRHCLRRAAASVSERHPFFLLRAERGLAGPSPIRFSPALWARRRRTPARSASKMPVLQAASHKIYYRARIMKTSDDLAAVKWSARTER